MIPSTLIELIEKQPGDIHRVDKACTAQALKKLDIEKDTEFSEFFLTYTITAFMSESSDIELLDIINPNQIEDFTDFVREVWELPVNFICLTSTQSEGCYLYDKKMVRL